MRRFMCQPRELMLSRADQKNCQDRDRHVEPDRPVIDRVKVKCGGDDQSEVKISAQQIEDVGNVVGYTQLLKTFLDARVAERGKRRRCWRSGGHDRGPLKLRFFAIFSLPS